MIRHDFIYAKPDTKEEAVALYMEYVAQGLNPAYYGGGSEIITMCRMGTIKPGAVIDLKGIQEANELHILGDTLTIGGCVTLRAISDSKLFPLLGTVGGRIADHTNQCRITLAGNLCGTIRYREAVQPLLLCDAEITFFGPQGLRTASIHAAFDQRMRLETGEMLLQVQFKGTYRNAQYCHVKKAANERIDYPLLSVSSVEYEGRMRFAFSGIAPYPFRSKAMEEILNRRDIPALERAEEASARISEEAVTDYRGSGAYRLFVLRQTLSEMLNRWKK